MKHTRCDQTRAWVNLQAYYSSHGKAFNLHAAFGSKTDRFEQFSQSAPHMFVDLSKNLIDEKSQQLLYGLVEESGVLQHREEMFSGEKINSTEKRAAMHFLLRWPHGNKNLTNGLLNQLQEVHQTLDRMLAYAERIRSDDSITDIVNIGIGGSDLGPVLAIQALVTHKHPKKRFHFVSSLDGVELGAVLDQVQANSTLFVVASKTFTTQETITNAQSAREWFVAQGGREVAEHFCAVTSNVEAAQAFGIQNSFGFWDWVGGRYSMWSAIGLPIAISIGQERFREMLAGAHEMDEHFRLTPVERNLPIRLAVIDLWYRNFFKFGSRNIAPYHRGLRRLPAYLQQLEMESNGKSVDLCGEPVAYQTAPVVWGELGANGQHAYFQLLHQGTDIIPVEFVAVKKPPPGLKSQHRIVIANALAQARALMMGQATSDSHREMSGNRPSTFILLEDMSPASLGALIALNEHRVFVTGSLWGINSFDQWGVELGKVLAKDMSARLSSGSDSGLDASSAGLLHQLRS
jgi:glucose-6-phosphate isomerase